MLKLKTSHWKQGKSVIDSLSCILLFLGTIMTDKVKYKWADFSERFLSKMWVLLLVMKRLLVKLRAPCRVKGMNFYNTNSKHLSTNEPVTDIILIAGT